MLINYHNFVNIKVTLCQYLKKKADYFNNLQNTSKDTMIVNEYEKAT